MPTLYSPSECTPNVHYLTHICHYVKLWGPLWGYSMFGYENMNGYIKKEFHGSRKVLDQLVFNVQMRQSLPIVHNLLCKTESPQTTSLLKKLSGQRKHLNMTSVGPNAYFVTKPSSVTNSCICCFKVGETLQFGQILFFCYTTTSLAIVNVFKKTGNNIFNGLITQQNTHLVEMSNSVSNNIFHEVQKLSIDCTIQAINLSINHFEMCPYILETARH